VVGMGSAVQLRYPLLVCAGSRHDRSNNRATDAITPVGPPLGPAGLGVHGAPGQAKYQNSLEQAPSRR
jgi:hypothetical protein